MVEVEIENIIASATISDSLDLPKIAEAIDGAEYNPDRFPGVVLRFESPRVVVLLFDKGKMMCTGGRSLQDVQDVMDNIFETLTSMNLLSGAPEESGEGGGEGGAEMPPEEPPAENAGEQKPPE